MKAFVLSATIVGLWVTSAMAENWPRFRGPTGQGVSPEKELPIQWTAEENVAWKTSIRGLGWSSPIVWNDFVFVTTATNDGADCYIMALNRRTGNVVWDKTVLRQVPDRKEGKNSLEEDGHDQLVSTAGDVIQGFDLDSGQRLWSVYSPGEGVVPSIVVGDRLLFTLHSTNRLNERCQASIAISQGNLFIRTKQHLYCIGGDAN